ncbi:MAG: hypothetical protein LAP38_10850 [Acidobacteriia bacterium]|nr:hypothetical protein [Terriglobia bacterium]
MRNQRLSVRIIPAIVILSAAAAHAQISVTAPTASQVVSGTSFMLACSVSGLPNIYSAEWIVDGEAQGLVTAPPYALAWNPHYVFNSTQHAVHVVARDALGATLATSADVIFTTANTYTASSVSAALASLSVSTGTAASSPWSGVVTVTMTVSGTNATDPKTLCLYIDGIKGGNSGTYCGAGITSTSQVYNVDTTLYLNGSHWLYVTASDDNAKPSFGQWGRIVNFSNGNGAIDVLTSPHDYPISGGGTQTLTSVLLNQDGSTSTPWTMETVDPNNYSFVEDKIVSSIRTAEHGVATANSSLSWWSASVITLKKGAGSIALVHKASNSTSGGPGTLACPAISTTSGNAIVVFGSVGNGGPTNVSAVSDTGGNTYAAVVATSKGNGVGGGRFFVAQNITGNASNVITATFNGGNSGLSIHCLEYSGIATTNAVDVATGQGTTGKISTPAFTTTSANEVMVVGVSTGADNSPYSPAGVPALSSTNTSLCTVNSSTQVVTALASFGSCQVTTSNGPLPGHTIWGWIAATNILPHFGKDGNIYNSFNAQSFYMNSLFQTSPYTGFTDLTMTNLQFAQQLQAGGFNSVEPSCLDGSVGWGVNEAAFKTGLDNYINTLKTQVELVTPNLFVHPVCTSFAGGSHATYTGTYGAPASYSTPGWTYLMQKYRDLGHTVGFSMADEVNYDWSSPTANGQVRSNTSCLSDANDNCFVSVTSTGNGTCTVNWTNWAQNGTGQFGIFGATAHSALNTTPGGTLYRIVDRTNPNSFTFTAGVCSSAFTADVSSDAGMHIEPFIDQWESGSAYFHYNGLSGVLMPMVNSVVNRSKITWPAAAGSSPYSNYQFMGNNAMGDFGEFYWSYSGSYGGSALNMFPYDLVPTMGLMLRQRHGDMSAPRAWLALTNGTTTNHGDQGFTLGIDHISGNTVYFTGPHGMYNIVPDISRGWFAGTSNSYYNVDVFFDSCPTATTCTFALRSPSSSVSGSGGTATFVGGSSHGLASISGGCCGANQIFFSSSAPMYEVQRLFTISGNSQSYYNTNRFWLSANSYSSQQYWREVPPSASSATGGTATIIRTNAYVMGIQENPPEAVSGPRPMFMTPIYAALLGAAGHRDYSLGVDFDFLPHGSFPRFHDNTYDDNQSQIHPLYSDGDAGQTTGWYAASTANILNAGVAKFVLQPRATGAPDLGYQFETSLRSGSYGKLLMSLYFGVYPQARTVDLAACAASGQPTLRYVADWRGIDVATIAAGTTTDTVTFPPGGAVYYVCPLNFNDDYAAPVISARLADVPNATKIVVRYSYHPALLQTRFDNAVDCGSGTCALPVDRSLGTVYYQLQYLSGSGAILATSDQQTL